MNETKLTPNWVAEMVAKATPGPWLKYYFSVGVMIDGRYCWTDIATVNDGVDTDVSATERYANLDLITSVHDMTDLIANQDNHIEDLKTDIRTVLTILEDGRSLEELWCCNGHMCGCQAITRGEYITIILKQALGINNDRKT